MKKITLILFFIISHFAFSQTNGITYQAVLYNSKGESLPGINTNSLPMANKKVCLQFTFINSNSQVEYQERIQTTTDAFGMVNLVIGTGNQIGGFANSFNEIIWNNSQKKLKTELDSNGNCTSFEEISNQPLNYVPFALAANTANSVAGIVDISNGGTAATTVQGAKSNLQLENVDNTSDLSKPISTATQLALNNKIDQVIGKSLVSDQEIVRLSTITNSDTNKAYVDAQMANKVDKVAGKILSTEDYSTAEKTKLAAIIGINSGDQDLSSFATLTDLGLKVDKIAGKDLSTEDYSTSEKTKLAAITGTNTGDQDLSSYATITDLELKAAINSPLFTGTPTLPSGTVAFTQSAGESSTAIATTAFVTDAVNSATTGKFVDLSTNQIIAGDKIFNSDVQINSILIGKGAGNGDENLAVGTNLGTGTGYRNTGVGVGALNSFSGTSFGNNTGIGYYSLLGLTTGYGNTSIGAETMFNVANNDNNTAIGNQSLINAESSDNTATGANAGSAVTTGGGNTFVGRAANVSDGTFSNSTAIGREAIATASNTIQLGNNDITDIVTTGKLKTGAITIPNTDGVAGQVLGTNGSGIVSWINPSTSGLVDITTDQIISGTKSLNDNLRVGTTTPTPSAVLEVSSTTQGFLPPRMTQTERNSISSPVAGLIVWCKNCGENGELQVFNGTKWTNFIGNDVQLQLAEGSNFRGGKIAYVFQSGDPGFVSGEFHGIIVSDSDLSNGIRWGQNFDGLSTTYDCTNRHGSSGFALPCAIGAGSTNTALIIASNTESSPTNYAAKICSDYSTTVNGTLYDDWFLPSYNEMLKIYQNKSSIGGLYYDSTNSANKSNWYWTSTGDVFQDRAADVNSLNGSKARNFRGSLLSVRAARYF
jgi:hypothetical protein